jgi:lipoyl(octanoyl) transferase
MTGLLLDLGRSGYSDVWSLQRQLAGMRARREIPDVLILVEHDHVITLGRKTSAENLKPQAVPVFRVERGGDATYHGPGQLVGYPIFLLEDHDVRGLVRRIETAIIGTAARFGISANTVEGHPGVWVDGRKLASIGLAVTDWVSYHGFALNVNTDLSYFGLIRPCGLDPSTMTSMESLLGRRVEIDEVKKSLVREFGSATGQSFEAGPVPLSAQPRNVK